MRIPRPMTEHCPRADEGAEILLIEPAGTVNTGDAPSGEFTADERPDLAGRHRACSALSLTKFL